MLTKIFRAAKLTIIFSIFLYISFVYSISISFATVYYVSSSGLDVNNGTSTSTPFLHHPWDRRATGVSVGKTLGAGDEVYFKRGETHTALINANSSGTLVSPIITGAYGSGSNPILTDPTVTYAIVRDNNGNYATFQDLDVVGGAAANSVFFGADTGVQKNVIMQRCNIRSTLGTGVYIAIANGNQLLNNNIDIASSTGAGIKLASASSTVIQGNILVNSNLTNNNNALGIDMISADYNTIAYNTIGTSTETGFKFGIGIRMQNSDRNSIYNNNLSYNWNGLEYPSSQSTAVYSFGSSEYNSFFRNYFYGNNIQITDTSGAGGDTVYYNVFSSGHVNGLDFNGKSTVASSTFYNNTVWQNPSCISPVCGHGMDVQSGGLKAIFKNNVIYSNVSILGNSQAVAFDGAFTSIETNNNLYYAPNGSYLAAFLGVNYSLFSDWLTALNGDSKIIGKDINSLNADPNFISTSTMNYQLSSNSPAIDAGTDIGLNSDYLGNPIYGTPDIGAYEYQPPFTLGTDLVDPTSNIRIYSDGKYRYTTATSSTASADFSVTPVGGYATYDASTTRPEYLNISNITWNTSGTYSKQWTASSSIATTTIYTVGDLQPSTYYTITVDGLASTTQQSNGSGIITYTYSGGYSTHTFNVSPTYALLGTPTNLSTTTVEKISIALIVDSFSNDTASSSGYFFSREGADFGWIQTNSWQDTGLSCNTSYTYSVKYRNGDGVETDPVSITQKTASCGGHSSYRSCIYTYSDWGSCVNGKQTRTVSTDYTSCSNIETTPMTQRCTIPVATSTTPLATTTATTTMSATTTATTIVSNPNSINLSDFINLLINLGIISPDKADSARLLISSTTTLSNFTKDLKFGQTDSEVKRLQIFLNTHGYSISASGVGSPGKETTYFGLKTKGALIKFQEANFEAILKPQNFKKGTGIFGAATRKFVNNLLSQ